MVLVKQVAAPKLYYSASEITMNGDATPVPTALPDKIALRIRFITVGWITVSLPLVSLIVCFFSAIIFQFEEVNKTVCNVSGIFDI